MTPLRQDTAPDRADRAPTGEGGPRTRPAPRFVIRRLRRLVPAQSRQLSWLAAERVAAAQAALLSRLAARSGTEVTELVAALPTVQIRHDQQLPGSSAVCWNKTGGTWVILLHPDQPYPIQRFQILCEFKHILDRGHTAVLYDPAHPTGQVQAEMAADYFAACALMPRRTLCAAIDAGHRSLTALAAHLAVPEDRLALRLADLNMTADTTDDPERRDTP